MGGRKKSEGMIVVNRRIGGKGERQGASERYRRGDGGCCSKMLGEVA